MPTVSVTDDALELIDEYRAQVQWDVSKKAVATKAIEEFHAEHVDDEHSE